MHPNDTADCFSAHMGVWACEPMWLEQAVAMFQSGHLPIVEAADRRHAADEQSSYHIAPGGVAIVPISGPMQKGVSKMGGTSTVATRRAIRAAADDNKVSAIMLRVESPGGHVSGTHELAEEVTRARASKPVHAHIDDLGASAAYWVASQAETITANIAARVGSIGVMTVLRDTSEAMERAGIKTHVIASSPLKGVGMPGSEITDEAIASIQKLVDSTAHLFVGAIAKGRNSVASGALTGEVFTASDARELGLIDRVMSFEDALNAITGTREVDRARARARLRLRGSKS